MRKFIRPATLSLIIIAAMAVSSAANEDAYSAYIRLLKGKIGEAIVYPEQAREDNLEGVVELGLSISGDGQLKDVFLRKSSGYKLLDQSARGSVVKASPYPAIPAELDLNEISVEVPIVYRKADRSAFSVNSPKEIFTTTDSAEQTTDNSRTFQGETRLQTSKFKQQNLKPVLSLPKESGSKILSLALPPPEELEGFIELAIENDQPIQIVRQEIGLAQLKTREARRNLLPALKLEVYTTEGEVSRVDYEEREIKLQLDQPVYYGGRLKDTFSQTKVNLEITKRNYERLRIDVVHKTEVAYYNLVASRMSLKIQKEILHEAKKILDIVQKQFAADLVTALEVSRAQSWYEQINFQINSTKQNIAIAELTFKQVLNIPELPEITQQELEIKKLNLNLNESLEVGLKNRPEIYLSELLVKFNRYGKRIEEAKDKFTIDLTTFYGHYQGAYKTEPMNNSDNWSIGIKATKPWGASTITTSVTTEETQPRFGETSPTQASTISTELRLLDNLKRLSEEKKAKIELQRSLSDLNETTKTINFEIENAYLDYQRALLQAATAQLQTEFRRREVEVLKVRAQVGEVELSNVIETLVSLLRAQTEYTQALANYFISLASLKKATGYGIIKVQTS